MTTARVKCPVCKKDVEWVEKNTFRPFCSERCKQIDLGAWADEKYTVPVVGQTEHGEEEALS
jgi:endogenous inhibitor of DNA gyrase (YacG/DUF329 family)